MRPNYDGMSIEKISEVTGIKTSTLKTRIYSMNMTKTEAVEYKRPKRQSRLHKNYKPQKMPINNTGKDFDLKNCRKWLLIPLRSGIKC